MRNSLKFLVFSIFGFLLVNSAAVAAPTVSEFRVNGYRVLLLNQHAGNLIQIGVHVPTGSLNDDPLFHAGRAHLWEHVIHRGTDKFPNGRAALKVIESRLGGNRNAYTADTRTFYYMYGHPDAAEEIVTYLGAQMSGPSWNEEAFSAERKVVMNEAKEYQDRDHYALRDGMFLELLDHGHPLKAYHVGTQDQLSAMTMGDLQDLYFSNYRPEFITVLVAGNFDSSLDKKKVMKLVETHFVPPVDFRSAPHRPDLYKASPNQILPLISPQKIARIVEFGTSSNQRTLSLAFWSPNPGIQKTTYAAEIVSRYFDLDAPGSLADSLRRKGLVTSVDVNFEFVNNLMLTNVDFQLTKEGAVNRYAIPEHIFRALNQLAEKGIEESLLAQIKRQIIAEYQRWSRSPIDSMAVLVGELNRNPDVATFFDFDKKFGPITASDIQEVASSFFPLDRMLVGYMGPEIVSPIQSQVFVRPMVKIEEREIFEKWSSAFRTGFLPGEELLPILKGVPLQKSQGLQIREKKNGIHSESRLLTSTSNGLTVSMSTGQNPHDPSVALSLRLPLESNRGAIARVLYASSFSKHFQSEIKFLTAAGILENFSISSSEIQIVVNHLGAESMNGILFLLDSYLTYEPSSEELQNSLLEFQAQNANRKQGFSATLANSEAMRVLNRTSRDSDLLEKVGAHLSAEEVKKTVSLSLKRADITLALVGEISQNEKSWIETALRERIPQSLTKTQRDRYAGRFYPISGNHKYWFALPPGKAAEAIGIVKIFSGVKIGSRDHAALLIFMKALGDEIFLVNRSRKGLGYIHGATIIYTQDEAHLALYGQTEGIEKWEEIALGWNEVTSDLLLKKANFKDEILGLQRNLELLPVTPAAEAMDVLSELDRYGQLGGRAQVSRFMDTLQPDEIKAVAKRVVLENFSLEVLGSNSKIGVCAGALTSRSYLQRKLRDK